LDQIERAEQTALAAETAAREAETTRRPLPMREPLPGNDNKSVPAEVDEVGLSFWNGFGGFADHGREYVVRLSGDRVTPQPWSNVFASPEVGFQASSEGAAFAWRRDSRVFRLTPWSNDPATNRPGEALYIRDMETGEAFSPQACVLRDPSIVYEARHAPGVSSFHARKGALSAELTQLVDPDDPVKVQRLRLTNHGTGNAKLRVYAYA